MTGPRAGKLQGAPGRSYTQKARKNLKDNEDMSEDTDYGKTMASLAKWKIF